MVFALLFVRRELTVCIWDHDLDSMSDLSYPKYRTLLDFGEYYKVMLFSFLDYISSAELSLDVYYYYY